MIVICSYCRKELGEKEPIGDKRFTHTICDTCYDIYSRQWDGLPLGEYLDDFETPVLIMDDQYRLIAANQALADMIGKPNREKVGLLGGEVFECENARTPEGCGRTIHCVTCAIRINLKKTLETGEPQIKVPASLTIEKRKLDLLISTYKRDRYVQMVIENVHEADSMSLKA